MDESSLSAVPTPVAPERELAWLKQQLGAVEAELRLARGLATEARAVAANLRNELDRAEQAARAAGRENAIATEQLAHLQSELSQIHHSLGWALIQKTRVIRARLIRGHRSGRFWRGCSRFLKTALARRTGGAAAVATPAESAQSGLIVRRDGTDGHEIARATNAGHGKSRPLTVSVIVPNYQHARYLGERLRSVFDQTYRPQEIIFLDDASRDESVPLVRRLAAQSPAPFHIVVNETNSGSTFRQWRKGIARTTGDLIWIAESDDACRPEFLETLVPEFHDPDVSIAYCQSAVIGPKGQKFHDDYLFHTDDISITRWRSHYRATGLDEVELALSQKNTIPNASAVVFRRPTDLDFAPELAELRLLGDWFFYLMRLRQGKIAFVPDVLNFHRRHDNTVRHAFDRQTAMFHEQLRVKARMFETFPVTTPAMTRSLVRTIREYRELTAAAGLRRPALAEHPELAQPLQRIRAVFQRRQVSADGPRILVVVDDMHETAARIASIRHANALASRGPVYLCNARPMMLSPAMAAQVDDRIVLLEGSLGVSAWTFRESSGRDGATTDAELGPRAEVIEELMRFHQIQAIHADGWLADRLVTAANSRLGIPRLSQLGGDVANDVA
jgi:glycosyltransferase involved in cell wall biosynthesis